MKKLLPFATLVFALILTYPTPSLAQGMMGGSQTVSESNNGHTAREEAEGKEIWEKLQAKEMQCEELSEDNFGALGEYYMGKMMGDSHESMNNMMIQMIGEEGEEEMHVALGKRMSGCEPNAAMPQNMMNGGMMQMMMGGGMMGNWSNSSALNNFFNPISMMNYGFMPFGWVFMILFWGLIIFGVVSFVKWLINENKVEGKGEKSALEILKRRYVKGEINKKEFNEMKKDLD